MISQRGQLIGIDLTWDTVIKFIDKKENVKRLISCYKADNSSRQKGQKSEGK